MLVTKLKGSVAKYQCARRPLCLGIFAFIVNAYVFPATTSRALSVRHGYEMENIYQWHDDKTKMII